MKKLEIFALNNENIVIAVVGFFPFFAVFTPAIVVEEFWQLLSFIYILILILIPVRRRQLIEKLDQKISTYLDVQKGRYSLPDDLDGRHNELTVLSDELDDAKELYSTKLLSTLNSSVILGLFWTLASAFYLF